MNVSEQVMESIIYDSRCWMSDLAFRAAPPIGGPSCFNSRNVGSAAAEIVSKLKLLVNNIQHEEVATFNKFLTGVHQYTCSVATDTDVNGNKLETL